MSSNDLTTTMRRSSTRDKILGARERFLLLEYDSCYQGFQNFFSLRPKTKSLASPQDPEKRSCVANTKAAFGYKISESNVEFLTT